MFYFTAPDFRREATPRGIPTMTSNPTITDTLKQKLDELEVERRLEEAVKVAEQAMLKAVAALSGYAKQHEAEIHGWLDKAGATIDDKTQGKYAGQVAQVKDQVRRGVATLADRADTDDES
jgi:hypothetical protein